MFCEMAMTMLRLLSLMVSMTHVTEGTILEAVDPHHLDPDATFVCTTIQHFTYYIIQSELSYFLTSYTTWCVDFPPRCTRYRMNSEKSYQSILLYQKRDIRRCCQGYYTYPGLDHCIPWCQDGCNVKKSQGICVQPNVCKCKPGFRGDYCETACEADRWGEHCENQCHCGPHSTCDPYKGNCVCDIGYTGLNCTEKCVHSFGVECAHPCRCENGATCDHKTGKCTCAPGFYGPLCKQECSYSSLDKQGCEQTCPCQNDGECHPDTGYCMCPPGYKGEVCTELCDRNQWGPNCLKNCFCSFGYCDAETGKCICEHGYAGFHCDRECLEGWYGEGCLTKCICENNGKCYFDDTKLEVQCDCRNTGYHGEWCEIRDCPEGEMTLNVTSVGDVNCGECPCDWNSTESCHPLDGECFCSPGYKGDNCSATCEMPYYGDNCKSTCACANGDCHHVTGNCTDCYAGYTGEYCNETCPNSTWGIKCVNRCECLNGGTCKPNTGYCACAAGYYGIRCELECGNSMYGPHCEYMCNCNPNTSYCDPYTGECHCLRGYTGFFCNETCENGWYGIHCRQECDCNKKTSVCDPKFGRCDCKPGYYGERCEEKCPDHLWGPYCQEVCDCNDNGDCDPRTGSCTCFAGFYGSKCDEVFYKMGKKGLKTDDKTNDGLDEKKVSSMVVPAVIVLVIVIVLAINVSRKYWYVKDKITNAIFRREKQRLINDKYTGDSDTDDENKDKQETNEAVDIDETITDLDDEGQIPPNSNTIDNAEPNNRPASPTDLDETELGHRPPNPTPVDNSNYGYRESNPLNSGQMTSNPGVQIPIALPVVPESASGAYPKEDKTKSSIQNKSIEKGNTERPMKSNGTSKTGNEPTKPTQPPPSSTQVNSSKSSPKASEVDQSSRQPALEDSNEGKRPAKSLPKISETVQRPPKPLPQVLKAGETQSNFDQHVSEPRHELSNSNPRSLTLSRSKSALAALNSGPDLTNSNPQPLDNCKQPSSPVPQSSEPKDEQLEPAKHVQQTPNPALHVDESVQTTPSPSSQVQDAVDVPPVLFPRIQEEAQRNFDLHASGSGRSQSAPPGSNSGESAFKPVKQASKMGHKPLDFVPETEDTGQIPPSRKPTTSLLPDAPFMFKTSDQKRSIKKRRYGSETNTTRGNKPKMTDGNDRPRNPVPPIPSYVPSLLDNDGNIPIDRFNTK